jgi:hypothetical protein
MAVSSSQMISRSNYGLMLKSFLLWTGILTVCLLITGFPVGIFIVAIGSLMAMMMHEILPGIGIVMVVGSFIAIQLVGVMVVAALLTLKGTHPSDVSWLPWLSGQSNPQNHAIFASCPLTCEIR